MAFVNPWHVPMPCSHELFVERLNEHNFNHKILPTDIEVSVDGIALVDHTTGHNYHVRVRATPKSRLGGSTWVTLTHPSLTRPPSGKKHLYNADDVERDVFAQEHVRIVLRCKGGYNQFPELYSQLKPFKSPRTVKQLLQRLRRFIKEGDIVVLRKDGTDALGSDLLHQIRFP